MATNSPAPARSGSLIQRDVEAPLHSLHHEINRLFGEVFSHGQLHRQLRLNADQQGPIMPSINVSETDGEMRISADLPGVKASDIDVKLVDDILTIRAEKTLQKTDEKESFHVVESSYGIFLRTLRLPYLVDTDKMQASFDNGVLTVRLPICRDKEKARKIPVQTTALDSAAVAAKAPDTSNNTGR